MELSKLEKSQIRAITQSQQWSVFERFAALLIRRFKDEDCLGESEWDTMKKTILREGRTRGVQEFFQELMNVSNEST